MKTARGAGTLRYIAKPDVRFPPAAIRTKRWQKPAVPKDRAKLSARAHSDLETSVDH